jgi:hypothetical protein
VTTYNKKKKKGHGGLKFMAFIVIVALLILGVRTGGKTEIGQRVMGHREDHRLSQTALTPRFAFASAHLRVTIGSMFNSQGTPVDLTTTREVTLDHQTSRASTDVSIERTATEVSPGVTAIPFDAINAKYSVVLTKQYRYISPTDGGTSWSRSAVEPYYYGTELDDHYIPMIDDIMGFELRELPAHVAPASPVAGFRRPAVDAPTMPPDATNSYSYDLDMETYRRVAPILAGRTVVDAAPDTAVTLTVAFDDVGLLRFVDVAIPNTVATTLAQQRGDGHSGVYHYTLEVIEISGEPIKIDVPTDVVDEADTFPDTGS